MSTTTAAPSTTGGVLAGDTEPPTASEFMASNFWWILLIVALFICCVVLSVFAIRYSIHRKRSFKEQMESDRKRKQLSNEIDAKQSRDRNESGISKLYTVRNPSTENVHNGNNSQSHNHTENKIAVFSNGILNNNLPQLNELESVEMETYNSEMHRNGRAENRKDTESANGSKLDRGDDDYYLVTMIEQNNTQTAMQQKLNNNYEASQTLNAYDGRKRGTTDIIATHILQQISSVSPSDKIDIIELNNEQ